MSRRLRKPRTRSCVQALPCPVSTPVRLSRRAICRSGISRTSSRTSAIVSSGMRGLCRPAAFSRCLTCSWVWSPPCQCRTAWMIAPSLRTTISVSAARRIRLRVAAVAAGCNQALQISTERHQLLALRLTERGRTARNQGGDLSFKLCDSLQCLVPAALQLAGDQPVCRVDSVVLSARVRGFVARLLQRQLQLALGRCRRARLRLDRFECCLDAERLQDAQDLVADRRIDAQAADRNAARGTVVRTRTVAIVAADLAAVVHMELAAAVAASQKSGQQQLAFPSCSATARAAHAGR